MPPDQPRRSFRHAQDQQPLYTSAHGHRHNYSPILIAKLTARAVSFAAPARNSAGLASGSTTPAVHQIGRLPVTAPQNGRISPWSGSIDP